MNFLLDQDVYQKTVIFLKELKHNVVQVSEIGMSQASDEELLKVTQNLMRIFVTRDRDFGNLVFVKGIKTGVIYLRIKPETVEQVHKEFELVLSKYNEKILRESFITIEVGRYRFRKI